MAYTIGAPTAAQFIDDNGDPATGHVLYFYLTGTTTPTNIAFDSAGSSLATSVTIGADGFPDNSGSPVTIYYNDATTYDIVRKDSGGTAYGPTVVGFNSFPAAGFTRRIVTANETYTPPATVKIVKFEAIGGGGGSGGTQTTTSGEVSSSGGGAGGGWVTYTTTSLDASYTLVIGTGGLAGAVAATGGTGGDSTITSSSIAVVAAGGLGGASGVPHATSSIAVGGAVVVSSGFDYYVDGQGGATGIGSSTGTQTSVASVLGGNYANYGPIKVAIPTAANAGSGYGVGGGARYQNAVGANTEAVGAAGADGVIIIYEYI